MLPKRITSLQHPRVKQGQLLRKDKSFREKEKKILIAGKKTIEECPFPLQVLFSIEPQAIAAQETLLVTESILKKITGLEKPDGIAAIVESPQEQDLSDKQFLLIADQISDPGNLGTLIRTALALNWEGIILTPGTVDLFNDKALRAACGATFHLPFCYQTPEQILSWIQHPFVADISGAVLSKTLFTPPLALILSNEAQGPSCWTHSLNKLSIPMHASVDSLNVAIAGAILLYAMRNP